MKTEQDFLDWLEAQSGYYISPERVEEEFPDLDLRLFGVTMMKLQGEWKVPKRDYRQAVTRGYPLD